MEKIENNHLIIVDKRNFIPIAGYEDRYEVNGYGEVRLIKSGKIRKHQLDANCPYPYVVIRAKGKYNRPIRVKLYIHRLLGLHFIPNPHRHNQINHIDGDKSNSVLENLEWVNASENQLHALKTGLRTIMARREDGSYSLKNKLDWEKVKVIRDEYPKKSIEDLAKEYGVKEEAIKKVIELKTWKPELEKFDI